MSERFDFNEDYMNVPAAAVDADPAQTMRGLMFRVSKLEQDLANQEATAEGETAEIMRDLVSLSDELNGIVQRWGIATNAQEAALVRAIVGLGRKLQQILAKQEVKPLAVVGQPLNPQTCDVAANEASTAVQANTVLREIEPGYTWKNGLLRKARVVISTRPGK